MCWLSWIITIIIKYLYCFYSPFLLRSYTAGHFHPIDQFNLSKSLLQPAEAELWDVGPWIITGNILHITWAVAWCITFHFSSKGAKMQTGWGWKEAWNLPKIASKRLGSARRGLLCGSRRWDAMKEHNTAQLGCCFRLIDLIHQRIYKACYLNAIFLYQNDNTIHKYSCTSSTDQSSSRVQSSTWRVGQTAEFHIIVIILSVIDRNKPCNIHL